MFLTERIVVSIAIVWAILALVYQWISARGSGRKDYSVKSGDPIKGVIYNFTWAMLPSHKESIRLHPGTFAVGTLMHIGLFYAIIRSLLLIVSPQMISGGLYLIGIIPLIGAFCALFLFAKRIVTTNMRLMSTPDDYISILLCFGFCAVTAMYEFGRVGPGTLLIAATVLFFYLPLGKLKHALFFFIARADYGARLGYRGVYPVKGGARE